MAKEEYYLWVPEDHTHYTIRREAGTDLYTEIRIDRTLYNDNICMDLQDLLAEIIEASLGLSETTLSITTTDDGDSAWSDVKVSGWRPMDAAEIDKCEARFEAIQIAAAATAQNHIDQQRARDEIGVSRLLVEHPEWFTDTCREAFAAMIEGLSL